MFAVAILQKLLLQELRLESCTAKLSDIENYMTETANIL